MQRVVILGGGESGVGAALLARKEGYSVFVSDIATIADKYRLELLAAGVELEVGGHTMSKILDADVVIKSPGIDPKTEVIQSIKAAGIPIWSEIEFAYRHCNKNTRLIAITGTNGKTTTTGMIYQIMKNAGMDVSVGGNIGAGFARLLATKPPSAWYVLEVSSFQLEDIVLFHPHIALITNLTANHLNRYDYRMDAYAAAKFNIFRNQTETDYLVYNLDSPELVSRLPVTQIRAQLVGFSFEAQPESNAWVENQSIVINELLLDMLNTRDKKKKKAAALVQTDEMRARGRHNQYNAMASAVVGNLVGLRNESVRESLKNFQGLEHRLEEAGVVNDVLYINDSKATNVNSAWFALQSMTGPTIWIVGGVDKGNDYGMLLSLVEKQVKAIVMLGKDVAKIEAAFSKVVPEMRHALSMEQAVAFAHELAVAGDVVLLSPACASFDLFENYEARGQKFKECVQNLN